LVAVYDAAPLQSGAEWLSRDNRSVASSCSRLPAEIFDLISLLKNLLFLELARGPT
jgi:hypothetical protein